MVRVSFWDTYPDAVAVGIFRELKQKRGDNKSSDMMWVIHCMLDPENTFMQLLPPKERLEELKKYYEVTGKEVSSELFKKCVAWYRKNWMTAPRRLLNSLREKLFASQELVDSHPVEKPDDIMFFAEVQEKVELFRKLHEEALKAFKAEGPVRRKLGGEPLSAADSGDIFDLI